MSVEIRKTRTHRLSDAAIAEIRALDGMRLVAEQNARTALGYCQARLKTMLLETGVSADDVEQYSWRINYDAGVAFAEVPAESAGPMTPVEDAKQ